MFVFRITLVWFLLLANGVALAADDGLCPQILGELCDLGQPGSDCEKDADCSDGLICGLGQQLTKTKKYTQRHCQVPLSQPEQLHLMVASVLGNRWQPSGSFEMPIQIRWGQSEELVDIARSRIPSSAVDGRTEDKGFLATAERFKHWRSVNVLVPDKAIHQVLVDGGQGWLRDWRSRESEGIPRANGFGRTKGEPWSFEGQLKLDASCVNGYPVWSAELSSDSGILWDLNDRQLASVNHWFSGRDQSSRRRLLYPLCSVDLWQSQCRAELDYIAEETEDSEIDIDPMVQSVNLAAPACQEFQQQQIDTAQAMLADRMSEEVEIFMTELWTEAQVNGRPTLDDPGTLLTEVLTASRLSDGVRINGEPLGVYRSWVRLGDGTDHSLKAGRKTWDNTVRSIVAGCISSPNVLLSLMQSEYTIHVQKGSTEPRWDSTPMGECGQSMIKIVSPPENGPNRNLRYTIGWDKKEGQGDTALKTAKRCIDASDTVFRSISQRRFMRTKQLRDPYYGTVYQDIFVVFQDEYGDVNADGMIKMAQAAHTNTLNRQEASDLAKAWSMIYDDLQRAEASFSLDANAETNSCYRPAKELKDKVIALARLGVTNLKPIIGDFDVSTKKAIAWFKFDNPVAASQGIEQNAMEIRGSLLCGALLKKGMSGCDAAVHKQWAKGWCSDVYKPAQKDFGLDAVKVAVSHLCEAYETYTAGAAGLVTYQSEGRRVDIDSELCSQIIHGWCR